MQKAIGLNVGLNFKASQVIIVLSALENGKKKFYMSRDPNTGKKT